MAEYIERDKLWDTFAATPFYDNADKDEIVLPIIDSFPAADVVPVVRCKDCKYNKGSNKCLNPDSFFAIPADNDFCSYGENGDR